MFHSHSIMNQATYVTVRHNFSRPFRDYSVWAQSTQDYRPGYSANVPSGLSDSGTMRVVLDKTQLPLI